MVYYNDYIKALDAIFAQSRESYNKRFDELKTLYDSAETRIRGRFKDKMGSIRSGKDKDVLDINNEISSLINGDRSSSESLGGKLRELNEKRDALEEEYKTLDDEATTTDNKRKDVRSKLFMFWWKSI